MLVKYKKDYEKIAMGFLSFIPDLKTLANVQAEIEIYQNDDTHVLYLWKDEDDNFEGLIGTEITDDFVMVQRISLSPSARTQTNVDQLLDELADRNSDKKIMGTMDLASVISAWEQRKTEKDSNHE